MRLTGGEPFLREDLAELAELVQRTSRPLVLHITTNGSFPERIESLVRGLPRPRRLRFMVSLDGLAEEHNRNRGGQAGFDTAWESIGRLVALRRSAGVGVTVNHTVISPRSMADADGLRARLARLDVDVQTVLAYADTAMYGLKLRGTRAQHLVVPRGYPLHPALAGTDAAGFVQAELERVEEQRPSSRLLAIGKRYYLRGLLRRLKGEAAPRHNPRCVALRSHLRLLPDGSVPVCQFNTEKLGSLRDGSFDELWMGEPASKARQWVDACPGCWAECEVIPSAIYSGDLAASVLSGCLTGAVPVSPAPAGRSYGRFSSQTSSPSRTGTRAT